MDFLGNLFNNFSGIMLCLFSRLQKKYTKNLQQQFQQPHQQRKILHQQH